MVKQIEIQKKKAVDKITKTNKASHKKIAVIVNRVHRVSRVSRVLKGNSSNDKQKKVKNSNIKLKESGSLSAKLASKLPENKTAKQISVKRNQTTTKHVKSKPKFHKIAKISEKKKMLEETKQKKLRIGKPKLMRRQTPHPLKGTLQRGKL